MLACNEGNQPNTQTVEPEIMHPKVDQHPGMKGVMIGTSLDSAGPRLKRINPISGLRLDSTTQLSEDKAVSFSLADSLQKIGEYKLNRITGIAYNDTIYTLKTIINGKINVIGIRKVLEEVYGQPKAIFDMEPIFNLEWNGSDVQVYYQSFENDGELYSILTFEHLEMLKKLNEEPDPYDHDAVKDF